MKYHYPDYYRRFICTGGDCEDTCCAGWQIGIDKKSYGKYKKYREPLENGCGRGSTTGSVCSACREEPVPFLTSPGIAISTGNWDVTGCAGPAGRIPAMSRILES